MFKLIVVSCLVFGLALNVSGQEEEEEIFAVDLKTKSSVHVQIPYFFKIESVESGVQEEFSPLLRELGSYINRLISGGSEVSMEDSMKAVDAAKEISKLLQTNEETLDQWTEWMGRKFRSLLNKNQQMKYKSERQLKNDVSKQVEVFTEVASNSPSVYIFVDWSMGLIDGRDSMDVYAELLTELEELVGRKVFAEIKMLLSTALDI